MFSILKPNETKTSIYDIDLSEIWEKGYHHIIVDIDNTITSWNDHQVSDDLSSWITGVKEKGFNICLLSNNSQAKVQHFAGLLGVLAAPGGGKPSNKAFVRALSMLQSTNSDTVVIGDQIFTDILGGNRMGLYTILVEPMNKDEFIGTKITRLLERLIAGRR